MTAIQKFNDGKLQFGRVTIDEAYRKEWNEHCNDFVLLCRGDQPIRNTLYRVGGMGTPKLNVDEYYLLLKYTEAFYPQDILKMSGNKDPKHLEGNWVILNKNGDEKVVFPHFKSPYLIKDSVLYSIDNNYYNIETGFMYCQSYKHMESNDFVFLDNAYDNDKSKRGVMKINKKDGTFELFPGK